MYFHQTRDYEVFFNFSIGLSVDPACTLLLLPTQRNAEAEAAEYTSDCV